MSIYPSSSVISFGGEIRSRNVWIVLFRAAIVVCLFAMPSLATNAIEPIDVSTQARMRGGADVAVGDTALSQVDNPASLALRPRDRKQFDFSGQLIFPLVHWDGPIDEADSEIKMLPLANMGVSFPMDDKLTFGLALHSKAGLAAKYHIRHLMIPFWDRGVGADMKDVSFLANVGYSLTDKLSVGAGIRAEVVACKFSTVLGPVDAEFGRGFAYGGGFQLGLHYQATEDVALGLAYRSPTWMTDVAGGDGEASLFGFIPIELGEININEFRLPQKVTAGVAWDVTEWCKLVGEVRWKNYSNSSLNACTVATNGLVDARIRLPMGYRDQWILIAGAEFKLSEHWKAGVGYNYCTNPAPNLNLLPIASVINQHHVTAGLRYEQEKWWVGGGYILGFPNSMSGRSHTRIPFGIDYAYSKLTQTQHHLFFGFGFSWQ